jgi:hypothetical protein
VLATARTAIATSRLLREGAVWNLDRIVIYLLVEFLVSPSNVGKNNLPNGAQSIFLKKTRNSECIDCSSSS